MRLRTTLLCSTVTVLALGVTVARRADAQEFPALGSLEIRVGAHWPDNAKSGFGVAADVDLGWFRYSNIRAIIGTYSFSADVDAEATGDRGSYSAVGGRVGVRLGLFRVGAVHPYLAAALTGTQVDADIVDPRSDALLDGFYVGAELGVGASLPLTGDERLSAVSEWRRTFTSNIDRYALDLGVRYVFGEP